MKPMFYKCSICGKRLVVRKPNGIFSFMFSSFGGDKPLIHLEIHGSIRMRCIRRSCRQDNPDHWNIFNFTPKGFSIAEEKTSREELESESANPANNSNQTKGKE
jgi:hypothetical protein